MRNASPVGKEEASGQALGTVCTVYKDRSIGLREGALALLTIKYIVERDFPGSGVE